MSDPFEFPESPGRDRERSRRRDEDDFDPPRRRDRRADDDRYDDDRPRRRRDRDDDYDDRPPRRRPPDPIEPKVPRALPGAISLAGTGWVIFGALNMLGGTIVVILSIVTLATADRLAAEIRAQEKALGPRERAIVQGITKDRIQTAAVQQGAMGAFSLLVGLLFFIFGIAALRSKSRDVLGQAITSLILAGIMFIAFFLLVGALKEDGRQVLPDSARRTIWITALSTLLHCCLLGGSGISALIGRRDYLLWVNRDRRRIGGAEPANPNTMTGDDFASTFG